MTKLTNLQNTPHGWQKKSLGKFLSISKGKLPKKTYEIANENLVPYLSIKYLDGAEFKYAHKTDGVIADKNDLLVIADGSGSGRMYRGYYGLVSSTFLKISSQSPSVISNDYIEVLFSHLDFTKSRFRKGGAIPHFDFKQLQDVDILLPPIKEQQKIAEILGAVDEEITKIQKVIKVTEKLKRGLMQQLFTRGIRHTKFKKTKIGQIPDDWDIKPLGDILDYERPDKYIVKVASYSEKAKTPVLTANKSFILGYTDENFGIYKNVPVIIFDDFTTDSKLVNFPFKIKSSAIKILKGKNKDINLRFVFEKMKSINFPTGSHKRFYISQYQNMEIAMPSLPEQNEIANIFSTVDEKILVNKRLKEKLTLLKKGLMQDLLSGNVRVN